MCLPALLAAAAVASGAGVSEAGADAGRALVLLERQGSPREEATLLEALRIYTRDLAVALRSAVMPPDTGSAPARATAPLASCGLDVAVVLWFTGDRALQLNALSCDTRTIRAAPLVPVEDLDLAAQTLALKVRGLLARMPSVEREEWQPVSPPPPSPAPPPAPLSAEKRPADPGPVRGVGFVRAGWGLGSSYDTTWLRHGPVLGLTFAPVHLPLELGLDAGVTNRPTREPLPGAFVTVGEVMLGLSAALRFEHRALALSAGPRVALHVWLADAERPGTAYTGGGTQSTMGLGTLGQLRYLIGGNVGVVLGVTAEALLPRQRFTSGQEILADLGYFQWGLSAGLVLRVF